MRERDLQAIEARSVGAGQPRGICDTAPMGRLTQEDKDRIGELWAAARERLARIAEGAAGYFEQPEHDQSLVDAMKEAVDEVHTLKMQGLHHFPPYETLPGAPPLLAPHLYDLFSRIRGLLVGVSAPMLASRWNRDRLRREIAEVASMIGATTAGNVD